MAERAPPDSRIFEARNHRNVPALFHPFWGIRLKRPFDGHRLRARVANSETQVARLISGRPIDASCQRPAGEITLVGRIRWFARRSEASPPRF